MDGKMLAISANDHPLSLLVMASFGKQARPYEVMRCRGEGEKPALSHNGRSNLQMETGD